MNKILIAVLCTTACFCAFAQDKVMNDPHAQTRSVKGFHGIRVSHGIDLYLTQGNEEAVAVSASSNEYRDKIITEVENGVLKIYVDRDNSGFSWNWGNHKLKAYVSCKTLDELSASGGSDVFFESVISSDRLSVNLSGGSDLKGKVSIHDMLLHQSGGSDAYISGTASNLKAEASGGSDLHGYDLVTEVCDVHASGGSDARITVNKELSADASGGSDIYYKGHGVVKDLRSSGSGSVTKKD